MKLETGLAARVPVDIVLAIDISGSMASPAALQGNAEQAEVNGISQLSIVDHAMRAVASSMGAQDRLGVVTYSDKATVVRQLMFMNEAGKGLAKTALDTVEAKGATNLWDGLYVAMELLRNAECTPELANQPRYSAVLLLTDGQPNIFPPLGFPRTLQKYRDRTCKGKLPATLHTFGFGYELDSTLLCDLARFGGGCYSFIPDAGFVGTCFINSMASIFTSALCDVELRVTPASGTLIVADQQHPLLGALPAKEDLATGIMTIPVGQVHAQQPRYLTFSVVPNDPAGAVPMPQIEVSYCLGSWTNRRERTLADSAVQHDLPPVEASAIAVRCGIMCKLFGLLDGRADTLPSMRETVAQLQTLRDKLPRELLGNPLVGGIFDDIKGQVSESVSREEWYTRWGRHYLPSLLNAHAQCFCNNFKDPGLQSFGGALFAEIRDDLDDIFLTLPPPKPRTVITHREETVERSPVKAAKPAARRADAFFSMASYHDRYSGCFSGDGAVSLSNNTTKPARDVHKGDSVLCADGSTATVLCTVRTRLQASAPLVKLAQSGLIITPWHPVRLNPEGPWQFPCKLPSSDATAISVSSAAANDVYTFVLSNGHSVYVNGVPCVTLAHGFTDEVCKHDFFGTKAVVSALEKMEGFTSGLVDLTNVQLRRDPATQRVCGFDA